MELFSPSPDESFRSIREDEVSTFIETIASNQGKSPINICKEIISVSYGITSRAAFSKKSKCQDENVEIIAEAAKLASGFCLAD